MESSWRQRLKAGKPIGDFGEARARGELAALSSFFAETKNTSAAWLCWYLARKLHLTPPEAVCQEVDRFAAAIAEIAAAALDGDTKSTINDKLVARLWSPRNPSGRFSEKLLHWRRDVDVAQRVYELRDKGDITLKQASEQVADAMNMQVENVKAIYNKYRGAFIAAEAELNED